MAQVPNPPVPNPTPAGTNVGRIGRALGGIASFLGGKAATWTADELEARWSGLKSLLYLSIIVPLASFVVGALIGRLGIATDAGWLVTVADWLIAVGGFLGGLLVTYLWTKLMVYGSVLGYGSNGLHRFVSAVPALDTAAIDRFLTWARGWTAWWMGAMLYVIVVPCYRNLTVSAVAMLSLLALAGILSVRWFDGPWARRFLLAGVLGTFLFATVVMFMPGLTRSLRSWSDGYLADADVATNRATALNAVNRTAEENRTDTLTKLSESFSKRRTVLERSMLKCGGNFCSDEDRAEYTLLGQKIGWIRDGVYLERMSGGTKAPSEPRPSLSEAPAAVTQSGSASPPAVVNGASRLAPPPILDGDGPTSPSSERSERLPLAAEGRDSRSPASDYGYGDLDRVLARHGL